MHARVRMSAPALLGLLVAAGLTGCSGTSGTSDANGTAGASGATASTTVAAAPLIEGELRALVLQEGDVPQARPGGMSVQDPLDPADRPSFEPASDPDCATVHDVLGADTASAVVHQVINWKDGIFPGDVTLASYEEPEAERLFARLERALGACHTYRGDGWTGAYTSTMKAQKAPQLGDGALQFREYSDLEGRRRDALSIVVRTGGVIALYSALDVGRTPNFPTEVIALQTERLRDAQD